MTKLYKNRGGAVQSLRTTYIERDEIMINENLNENLKKICEEKDISAYHLAKITQLPISVVAKIIRDEVKNPRLDTIIKIADALDVTLDELVGRKRK